MSDSTDSKLSEISSALRNLKDYPPNRDEIKRILEKVESLKYDMKHVSEKIDSFMYEWERLKDKLATKDDLKKR